MGSGGRRAIVLLTSTVALGLSACGQADEPPERVTAVPDYRPGAALDVHRTARQREGRLRVEEVTFRAASGRRVSGLFAEPTRTAIRGCVLFQPDYGIAKEAPAEIRQGFAMARLATFTIDVQGAGAADVVEDVGAAVATPVRLQRLVLETVLELRSAVQYLTQRRECRGAIAYIGHGFGAVVGTLVSGQDRRVDTTVLISVGASFEALVIARSAGGDTMADLPAFIPEAVSNPAVLKQAVELLSPYDPKRWIGRIAPRPVMVMNGRFDRLVGPGTATELMAAARRPKVLLYYAGGADPFAAGPTRDRNLRRAGLFIARTLKKGAGRSAPR